MKEYLIVLSIVGIAVSAVVACILNPFIGISLVGLNVVILHHNLKQ